MLSCFERSKSFSANIQTWDTSNVINMKNCFSYVSNLDIFIGDMDTSSVITMEAWSDHSGSLDLNRPREVFPDLFDMGYRYGQIGNSPDFIFIHESQL